MKRSFELLCQLVLNEADETVGCLAFAFGKGFVLLFFDVARTGITSNAAVVVE
jgi:hypothetical protein